eukprot:1470007-Prymnesium_polylepis.1
MVDGMRAAELGRRHRLLLDAETVDEVPRPRVARFDGGGVGRLQRTGPRNSGVALELLPQLHLICAATRAVARPLCVVDESLDSGIDRRRRRVRQQADAANDVLGYGDARRR